MNFFGRKIEGFAQWLVFLVVVLLIAGGLCGLQWGLVWGSNGRTDAFSGLFVLLGALELAVMALAIAGILFVLLAWPASIIYERFGKRSKDSTLHLFPESQEEKKKNESPSGSGESEDG